ncbi:SRPBCC family protein [Terrabacter sp. 2RAF25]|uniref:SRPBCC family protein n=1 Tax=Terrabacter sp. 2RAF25 TaxID=3232998 RepID=UPI003F9531FD
MRTTVTETGTAAPAVAWSRYDNLDLWATWSPQVQEVIAATRRLAPGLTGLVVGPLGVRLPFEVLTVDADAMEWSWHVRFGLVHATLDHAVRPAPDGGCTSELVIDAPAYAVLAYRPVAALALRSLVKA